MKGTPVFALGRGSPRRALRAIAVANRRAPVNNARMLVLDKISIRVAGRLLLDDASARIPEGARVGLVGRNGIGKTTLFRAIAGEIGLEHGSISTASARPRCSAR